MARIAREFLRARRRGPLTPVPFVLGLQARLLGQGLLPGAFERAGHQAVLGLDRVVLAPRPIDLVARPFQALLPVTLQRRAFGLEVGRDGEADLEGRRPHRLQDQLGHQRVERRGGERLAQWGVVDRFHGPAQVACVFRRSRPLNSNRKPATVPT